MLMFYDIYLLHTVALHKVEFMPSTQLNALYYIFSQSNPVLTTPVCVKSFYSVRYSVVPINSLLLLVALYSSVITTLFYNATKYQSVSWRHNRIGLDIYILYIYIQSDPYIYIYAYIYIFIYNYIFVWVLHLYGKSCLGIFREACGDCTTTAVCTNCQNALRISSTDYK
jgi:hypothetical protein